MSKMIPAEKQGQLQGGIEALSSLTHCAGPLIASGSFGYFIKDSAFAYIPGIAFFISAVFYAIALLLIAILGRAPLQRLGDESDKGSQSGSTGSSLELEASVSGDAHRAAALNDATHAKAGSIAASCSAPASSE